MLVRSNHGAETANRWWLVFRFSECDVDGLTDDLAMRPWFFWMTTTAALTTGPRMARDELWATTLKEAWAASGAGHAPERSLEYDCDGARLSGVLVGETASRGVVIYHTAAGPRDLFLHWKANQLVDLSADPRLNFIF